MEHPFGSPVQKLTHNMQHQHQQTWQATQRMPSVSAGQLQDVARPSAARYTSHNPSRSYQQSAAGQTASAGIHQPEQFTYLMPSTMSTANSLTLQDTKRLMIAMTPEKMLGYQAVAPSGSGTLRSSASWATKGTSTFEHRTRQQPGRSEGLLGSSDLRRSQPWALGALGHHVVSGSASAKLVGGRWRYVPTCGDRDGQGVVRWNE
jgi:hypothetical protein